MPMGQPMPPQAPGAQAPQGGEQESGGASQLVVEIQEKMSELGDLLGQSGAVSPEDKQAFAQIMTAYQSFVEQNLGSAPGSKPQPQGPGPQGSVPMEAGSREVTPRM